MSEGGLYENVLAGMRDAAPAPRPPRASASVVLWRRGGDGELEVFCVRRAPELQFMGGWYAFPGGTVGKRDAEIALAGGPSGVDEAPPDGGMPAGFIAEAAPLPAVLAPGVVAAALRELFEETGLLLAAGAPPSQLGDPRALGRRGALLAVAGAVWRRHLGPLLSTKQVAELLGVGTRQAVNDLVRRRRILALPTGERDLAYPAFQFGETGRPYRAVGLVLEAFSHAGLSPHTIASWFVTPQPVLDDRTPARWLAERCDTDRLVAAARRSASQTSY